MAQRENMHYAHGSFFIKAVNNLVGRGNFYLEGDDLYENIKHWLVENPPTADL
jgi:hypothetical protein